MLVPGVCGEQSAVTEPTAGYFFVKQPPFHCSPTAERPHLVFPNFNIFLWGFFARFERSIPTSGGILIQAGGDVLCCQFAPGNGTVAAGLSTGAVNIYNLKGDLTACLVTPVASSCTCLRYLPATKDVQNQLLATYTTGEVRCSYLISHLLRILIVDVLYG
jgi:hypothetical protein